MNLSGYYTWFFLSLFFLPVCSFLGLLFKQARRTKQTASKKILQKYLQVEYPDRFMKTFYPLLFLLWAGQIFGALDPLEQLIEGNKRYVNSKTVCHQDWTAQRTALLEGQKPFAIIIACSDSRVPPEIVFDQSLGELFIIRVAGNVLDDFAIGSIEYGTEILGAKLIVVLGHANCGAVDAALKGLRFNNHIQEVLNAILPAIQDTKGTKENLLEKAIKANVQNVEKTLKNSKPLLSKRIEEGSVRLKGAYYHLDSGRVEFLN